MNVHGQVHRLSATVACRVLEVVLTRDGTIAATGQQLLCNLDNAEAGEDFRCTLLHPDGGLIGEGSVPFSGLLPSVREQCDTSQLCLCNFQCLSTLNI